MLSSRIKSKVQFTQFFKHYDTIITIYHCSHLNPLHQNFHQQLRLRIHMSTYDYLKWYNNIQNVEHKRFIFRNSWILNLILFCIYFNCQSAKCSSHKCKLLKTTNLNNSETQNESNRKSCGILATNTGCIWPNYILIKIACNNYLVHQFVYSLRYRLNAYRFLSQVLVLDRHLSSLSRHH